MKKIIVGITAPLSVILLRGQMSFYRSQGYETYLLAPADECVEEFCRHEGCTLLNVDISREINILGDIFCFLKIVYYFLKIRPDIVNVGTPKMGVLGSIAAIWAFVPRRIFTCRGFRFEHERGFKRFLLKIADTVACSCAQNVVCISQSVLDFGIENKIFSHNKAVICGRGSSNGVDLKIFNRDSISPDAVSKLRSELNLENCFVFGFVGRIIARKGIAELVEAFSQIYDEYKNVKLLIVGMLNSGQLSDKGLMNRIESHPGIVWVGFQKDVPLYLSVMDLFVLPSWWEGFGNTLIQAAAMGIAVISTKVTGCVNAVQDGVNGMLVNPKNTSALKEAMIKLYRDTEMREKYGANGLSWAREFDSQLIWGHLINLYESKTG